jgi:hypothetical protein
LVSVFVFLVFGFWFLVSVSGIPFWFPVSGFRFPVAGFWMLISGFRFLVPGSNFWLSVSGLWYQFLDSAD